MNKPDHLGMDGASPSREERIDQLAGALIAARRRMEFDLKARLASERNRLFAEIGALIAAAVLFIWLKDSVLNPLPQLIGASEANIEYFSQIILVLILIGLALKGGKAAKSYFGRTGQVRRTFSNEIIEQIKNLNIGLKDDVIYDILERVSSTQTLDAKKYAEEILENAVKPKIA